VVGSKRSGVWREKHHFVIRMKITNKRRVCGNILNNKQNLGKYGILQIALFHFTVLAIQWGILEEELGLP
jgi:hypothetical protein